MAISTLKDQELIDLCALRYAFGRHTYIVSFVANWVLHKIPEYSDTCIKLMYQELIPLDRLPMDRCDYEIWENLKNTLSKELDSRNIESLGV